MYAATRRVDEEKDVSDQDSFISEVNEAVRQDELYGYVRKYGWIAALVVIALVGGAAWNEYRKAQSTQAAEALGDNLLNAVSENDPVARADALAAIVAEGSAASVTGLMTAAAQSEAGDADAARATLEALSLNEDVGQVYRDIAQFKAALLDEGEGRLQKLEALAQPGSSLRLLAEEQMALIMIENGEIDAAVAALRSMIDDAEITQSLRDRAQTLIVALGAPLDDEAATGQ